MRNSPPELWLTKVREAYEESACSSWPSRTSVKRQDFDLLVSEACVERRNFEPRIRMWSRSGFSRQRRQDSSAKGDARQRPGKLRPHATRALKGQHPLESCPFSAQSGLGGAGCRQQPP